MFTLGPPDVNWGRGGGVTQLCLSGVGGGGGYRGTGHQLESSSDFVWVCGGGGYPRIKTIIIINEGLTLRPVRTVRMSSDKCTCMHSSVLPARSRCVIHGPSPSPTRCFPLPPSREMKHWSGRSRLWYYKCMATDYTQDSVSCASVQHTQVFKNSATATFKLAMKWD